MTKSQRPGTAPVRARPNATDEDPVLDEVAQGLYDELVAWRLQTAGGKPAYTVFSNATLEEIARQRPSDLDGLRRISGVGPMKLESYGAAVLDIVAQHG